jgi:hypothetical protein
MHKTPSIQRCIEEQNICAENLARYAHEPDATESGRRSNYQMAQTSKPAAIWKRQGTQCSAGYSTLSLSSQAPISDP